MEIKNSVTPSGVKFGVRYLIGSDQDLLTKQMNKSDSGAFNEMLFNALEYLGDKTKQTLTLKDVKSMLSNDRKFTLVVLRQHTLDYKKEFQFKFEFPLRQGGTEKQIFDFTVNFTHENFPVKPYHWVRTKIEELKKTAKDDNVSFPDPDGHIIEFPVIYNSYKEMLDENKFCVIDRLPKSGLKLKWELLDGEIERQYADQLRNDMRINLMIDMRKPKFAFLKEDKETYAMYETQKYHIMDLEEIRMDIQDKEGSVDTSLTIQHPDDPSRKERVDLVSLPVFFFPSLGR